MSKNMILVSSVWKDKQTFKLIPIDKECPYNECIWDDQQHILAIVSKEKKDTYHFLPKLDDSGDIQAVKKPRPNKQPYAEQRVMIETYYEYFISDIDEISDFIDKFATNSDTFDYKKYLSKPVDIEQKTEAA